MDETLYSDLTEYCQTNILPQTFPSTQGNFVKLASNYHVNAQGQLMRHNKFCVKMSERDDIFQEMHCNTSNDFKTFSLKSTIYMSTHR